MKNKMLSFLLAATMITQPLLQVNFMTVRAEEAALEETSDENTLLTVEEIGKENVVEDVEEVLPDNKFSEQSADNNDPAFDYTADFISDDIPENEEFTEENILDDVFFEEDIFESEFDEYTELLTDE